MKAPDPGTTLKDPVAADWRPDLTKSEHDISEYLRDQNAYDLFDSILKELVTTQPKDPIQHMLDFLQAEHPLFGPLKVIVSGSPGTESSFMAKRLAEQFSLIYIGGGDLMKAGESKESCEAVMKKVKEASKSMQGFVLEGFPRSRIQTTYLKEGGVVPTHVLVLESNPEGIRTMAKRDGYPEEEIIKMLPTHTCSTRGALETYKDVVRVIDTCDLGLEGILAEMIKAVRMLPRSKGPKLPPRTVILGPRGVGVPEHGRRLAERLGAVYVDGEAGAREALGIPNVDVLAAEDKLGIVGVRLRQPDCTTQGWVLGGFPCNEEMATLLDADDRLLPTRVVALQASEETCTNRLRHLYTDPVTGEIWTSLPRNIVVRKRLVRNPLDHEAVVAVAHQDYTRKAGGILNIFRQHVHSDGRCLELDADGLPESVFSELAEFVERPLPLPAFTAS